MNTSGVSFESLMEEKLLQEEYADVAPSVHPGANEVYTYLFEAEQAYLEIMKALALQELKQTAFSQATYMYEANSPVKAPATNAKPKEDKGFLAKAIDAVIGFIKKIWNGIVGVWKWLVAKFDEYIRFNSSFVEKYSRELAGIDSVKFDGYSFANLAKMSIGDTIIASVKAKAENIEDLKKVTIKSLHLPESNLDPKVDDIKECYYGSKSTVQQSFNIKNQLSYISSFSKDKERGNKALKVAKFWFKDFEDNVQSLAKSNKIEEANAKDLIAFGKWAAPIIYMAFTQYSKALVARAQQARAICIKALQEKEAKKQESSIEFTLNKRSLNEMLFGL